MAAFQTPIVPISRIEEHPNADLLELATVLGYTCVVRKGAFQAGQRVVYLPEGSLVPRWLCRALSLWDADKGKGRLAGKQGLRIKAIRLRGTVSQGLLYPVYEESGSLSLVLEGGEKRRIPSRVSSEEVAAALGVEKYVPPIPTAFEGAVVPVHGHTIRFDIESLQSYPDAIAPGEEVVMTEKLHGTWTGMGFDPSLQHPDLYQGGTLISSKGMSANGLAFKTDSSNERNLYVRTWRRYLLEPGHWDALIRESRQVGRAFHVLGETLGRGVQDLHYGLKTTELRAFAVVLGGAKDPEARFVSADGLAGWCGRVALEPVPELGRGPFSTAAALSLRDGRTTFRAKHVREGVVISPNRERSIHDEFAFVKWVSPDYLLRRGRATEFE